MTKELLEKLKNAKSNEEIKKIIEDNKSVLNDEELEQIDGGIYMRSIYYGCNCR